MELKYPLYTWCFSLKLFLNITQEVYRLKLKGQSVLKHFLIPSLFSIMFDKKNMCFHKSTGDCINWADDHVQTAGV